MADWGDILRSQIRGGVEAYAGIIHDDAASVGDDVRVRVIAHDKNQLWGPAPWMPRVDDNGDPVFPQHGDECVVLLAKTDDPGEPVIWIVGWKP